MQHSLVCGYVNLAEYFPSTYVRWNLSGGRGNDCGYDYWMKLKGKLCLSYDLP